MSIFKCDADVIDRWAVGSVPGKGLYESSVLP
jgi:hypothetical protein